MQTHQILPDIGAPVASKAFEESAIDSMSIGEMAYAATLFSKKFAQRMADPTSAHEFATFITEHGADWSGLEGATEDAAERPLPVAPENYYDSIPGLAWMIRQQQHATEAVITHFAAHLEPALNNQPASLGTPVGVQAYRDGSAYFREVLKFSRQYTKKIHDRVPYLTWDSGKDPEVEAHQPQLPALAKSFAESNIPAENIDRIIAMDQDLTKYAHKVGATPDYKDEVLKAFEEALVEAAETATPDELSQAKNRWANTIAHSIDPDGPPVADALRKVADNAIKTTNFPDGSGRVSMHATPEVYAAFKNFALHQLNYNGSPVEIPENLFEFLKPEQPSSAEEPSTTQLFDDIDDLPSGVDPQAPAAEDSEGQTFTQQDIADIEQLSTGQRLGAILIGMFQKILTMDPEDLQIKSAHGASAQLMIVQDIQTAYKTLGIDALPEEVQRPSGPGGVVPPIIRRPNPDDSSRPVCQNPKHARGYSPPPWTRFMSEAVNIGPIHPKDTETLACDSKIVGQIWSEQHSVLQQHRSQRLFTPAQRRAILARDRGCQAPGCTIPAVYSQIHHIRDWAHGGKTNVDNGITLCAHHHAAIHQGKWRIRHHHGIHFFQPAPWLDPTQPLLRNLYWST